MSVARVIHVASCGLMMAGAGGLFVSLLFLAILLQEIEQPPPGAGPVLRAALDSGWRPGPAPKRITHDCSMCKNCCDKCNVEDKCCCKHVDKCSCPPPASPTRNP